MPAPLDIPRIPEWVREYVDAPSSLGPTREPRSSDERDRAEERAQRELRRLLRRAIEAFARELEFTLRVPGRHRSGIGYDELLEILAAKGKDFTADSRELRAQIKAELAHEFEDADAIPLRIEFVEVARDAILERIVARIENRTRDVRIAANASRYTRTKVRQGFDSRVGVRTRELLEAVQERGRVRVT